MASALENAIIARPELRSPSRHVAVAAARFGAALAALVCVPVAVLSGNPASSMTALGILSAALPSIMALSVLNQKNPDRAMATAGTSLAVVAFCAVLSAGATIGLALLAIASLIEAVIYGSRRQRRLIFSTLLFTALIGAMSPLLPGQGGISGGRIDPSIMISAIVALVQGATCLLFAVQRMLANEHNVNATLARMRELIMALGDVALIADRSGRALIVSDNAGPALGLPDSELQGRGLVERTHLADRPALLKAISDAVAEGVPGRVKLRLRRTVENGGARYFWAEARVLRASDAERAILVLRDISETQDEIDRLQADDALRQAAARNRGLFISSLSHEVRTPLNAVIGFSDMLANPDIGPVAPETVREYAGIIRDSGQQLFRLVTATIDLIRLDSGTYELNPESFGVSGLVDSCVEEVAEAAEARGVMVLRQVPPFVPDLTSDRRALQQAIVHVLSNAVKFAPAGSKVMFDTRATSRRMIFSISDDGPGIAPDHLAQICDPFFQGDNFYDRAVSGAGLGLALVKRLIDVLGGELRVTSRLGAGTRVEIDLPQEQTAAASGGAGNTAQPLALPREQSILPIHNLSYRKSA